MAVDSSSIIKFDDLPNVTPSEDIARLENTHFAKKQTIGVSGGEVYGNWDASFAGACAGGWRGSIPKDAILEMRDVGTCRGNVIVMVRHH